MHAVGECVWTHYLTMSEKAGRGGGVLLSAAQQQEVWVQYSALQIALQVRIHLQALASVRNDNIKFKCPHVIHFFPQAYHQSLKQQPGDSSLSGLSYNHLFFTSFSQVMYFH